MLLSGVHLIGLHVYAVVGSDIVVNTAPCIVAQSMLQLKHCRDVSSSNSHIKRVCFWISRL